MILQKHTSAAYFCTTLKKNERGTMLDEVVADDNEMHRELIKLQEVDDPVHTPRQNALWRDII